MDPPEKRPPHTPESGAAAPPPSSHRPVSTGANAIVADETGVRPLYEWTVEELERLDRRALRLKQVAWLVWSALFVSVGALVAVVQLVVGARAVVLLTTAGGLFALGIFLGAMALGWPPVWFRYVGYRADEHGLLIHRGVFWRSRVFIPRSRIQHTDVAQGPLERRLGLGRLVVHTAGTHNASTSLSGLAWERAAALREELARADETSRSDGV